MEASTPGPVFEDYEPTRDCGCAGCADRRRVMRLLPVRDGGHPAAQGGARRALVAATAASMVLGTAAAAAAAPLPAPEGPRMNRAADPDPPTEQGGRTGLHGAPGASLPLPPATPRPTTRAEIINRAKTWVAAAVPYDMEAFWKDGYRQDCSGYVSMAWDLGTNEWTGSLAKFAVRVTRDELQPGDILLFHNPDDPNKGSHVVIFGGWTDHTHASYTAYEQTPPGTRTQTTPYAYWKNSAKYLPYRYKGVVAAPSTAPAAPSTVPAVPSTGAATPSTAPATPSTGAATPSTAPAAPSTAPATPSTAPAAPSTAPATPSTAPAAPSTVPAAPSTVPATPSTGAATPTTAPASTGTPSKVPAAASTGAASVHAGVAVSTGAAQVTRPAFPGPSLFRIGQSSPYITQLGRQLVKKGFGTYYTSGPGPRWSEADRRNVEAFQRAQGWRGAEADGYPGPETWRRLFA
ncbi:peptidoglycan-binding protein [Streptomyces sp. NPDC048416]|uniref:peptidoglycan-binding protein n=1 Tax=Streptomyces sp. NPDC048416 TaxID=3365546 RepID=UPI003718E22D